MTLGGPGESLDRPQDLNRAIAEAMGWLFEWHEDKRPNKCGALLALPHWHNEEGVRKGLTDWTTSIDALRDGPERVLRAAGWHFTVALREAWAATWTDVDAMTSGVYEVDFAWTRSAPTEAEARARASLAALKALTALPDDSSQGSDSTASARERQMPEIEIPIESSKE